MKLWFLWWKNGDLVKYPSTYKITVNLFGASSPPGCLNYGLKRVASDGSAKFGIGAARFVASNFYMDDDLTVEEVTDLLLKTRSLCASGWLRLHKFTSNTPEVLKSIPASERATGLHRLLTFSFNKPM